MRRLTCSFGVTFGISLLMVLGPYVSVAFAVDDELEQVTDEGGEEPGFNETTVSPSFNESGGCGLPVGIAPPMSTTNSLPGRALPSDHEVRGPWASFFGRDRADVGSRLVSWTVPMSGGKTVSVHERALPAFQQVASNLAVEQAKGRFYSVRLASSFVWRRIGGSYRMSTHSFGTTIDMNWDTNPYIDDEPLPPRSEYTDMPEWFVKAWRDAGFCWGGDWIGVKDAMHFSWKGPLATPGYGVVPRPIPPDTSSRGFSTEIADDASHFASKRSDSDYFFGDGNRDGAPDLVRVRPWGDGHLLIEVSRSSRQFRACGVSRFVAHDAHRSGAVILGDVVGDSRLDLGVVEMNQSPVAIHLHPFSNGYRFQRTIETGVANGDERDFLLGDYDRDGLADLVVVDRAGPSGNLEVEVYSGASDYQQKLVDVVTPIPTAPSDAMRLVIGDRDVDGVVDLYVLVLSSEVEVRVLTGDSEYQEELAEFESSIGAEQSSVYGLGDYDGDGRNDLMKMSDSGRVSVYQGGNQGGDRTFWFRNADWECSPLGAAVASDTNGDRAADLLIGVPGEDVGSVEEAGLGQEIYGSPSGVSTTDILWHQDVGSLGSSVEQDDRFGGSLAVGDYDGDGFADAAFGAPADGIGNIASGGLVNVLYGTETGLEDDDNLMIHQDVPGVKGLAEAGDHFGAALTTGDFDGDSFDDLVVGAPYEDIGSIEDAGALNVFYGRLGGIDLRDQNWSQATAGIPGASEVGDNFAAVLTVGDFNGDSFDDLAIGSPGESVGGHPGAGAVNVIYGSPSGLNKAGAQIWSQASSGVTGIAETGDGFGASLAAGDFNGDGIDDLAVGSPGEAVGPLAGAGSVTLLGGSTSGLDITQHRVVHQDSSSIIGRVEQGDQFGSTLAAGELNGDGFADLVVGVPGESIGSVEHAGMVAVLFGSESRFFSDDDEVWHQDSSGVPGSPESGDRLGSALSVFDYNGDGFDDLAIGGGGGGVPFESVGGADEAGVVLVGYGGWVGVAAGFDMFHQSMGSIKGTGEDGDSFGYLTSNSWGLE